MAFYCNKFYSNGEINGNVSPVNHIWNNGTNATLDFSLPKANVKIYQDVMTWYVIPAICGFGLLGNLLALVVLLRRIREGVEMLEKSCLVGMIGK